jgi:hypothetical protein
MSKIKDLVKMKVCKKKTLECKMFLDSGAVIEKSFPAAESGEVLEKWINEFPSRVKLETHIKSVVTSIGLPEVEK